MRLTTGLAALDGCVLRPGTPIGCRDQVLADTVVEALAGLKVENQAPGAPRMRRLLVGTPSAASGPLFGLGRSEVQPRCCGGSEGQPDPVNGRAPSLASRALKRRAMAENPSGTSPPASGLALRKSNIAEVTVNSALTMSCRRPTLGDVAREFRVRYSGVTCHVTGRGVPRAPIPKPHARHETQIQLDENPVHDAP